jgi:hypothetical protein
MALRLLRGRHVGFIESKKFKSKKVLCPKMVQMNGYRYITRISNPSQFHCPNILKTANYDASGYIYLTVLSETQFHI